MATPIWFWFLFNLAVFGLLALDLGVFHRHSRSVSVRHAAIWSGVWVGLAFLFLAAIYAYAGSAPALAFLSGYLLEKSLAIDNIFVFVLIFGAFSIPRAVQHRVLFFGVIGALIMRGLMVAIGSWAVDRFDWVLYVFGAFLIVTAVRMVRPHESSPRLDEHRFVRLVRHVLPVSDALHGSRFFVREPGRIVATPLLIVLVFVEGADVLFALDSIPAVFGVTRDPFLVYSSNVFAILGLRSLFFLLADVIDRFHLLRYGLAIVLGFVGIKMLIDDLYHVPVHYSLVMIVLTLASCVLLSLWRPAPGSATHRPSRLEETAGAVEINS